MVSPSKGRSGGGQDLGCQDSRSGSGRGACAQPQKYQQPYSLCVSVWHCHWEYGLRIRGRRMKHERRGTKDYGLWTGTTNKRHDNLARRIFSCCSCCWHSRYCCCVERTCCCRRAATPTPPEFPAHRSSPGVWSWQKAKCGKWLMLLPCLCHSAPCCCPPSLPMLLLY